VRGKTLPIDPLCVPKSPNMQPNPYATDSLLADSNALLAEPKSETPYYGWCMVLVGAIAMAATLPGRTHGLGLITERLLVDFNTIDRREFAHFNLWATLIGAAFCLPCGWLIDRVGVRHVAAAVLGSLALVVWWMSRLQDTTSLFIAVTLTRGIGQSMLSVVSITMVAKWFQRRLGMAMGVYTVLMGLMFALGTPALGGRVKLLGWRDAWWELSVVLAAVTPLVWLLARNEPRHRSLEFSDANQRKTMDTNDGATLLQALTSPCFWVFGGSISFFGMVSSGISLFNQNILNERGFAEGTFHTVLMIGFLTGMVANLVSGGLSRRVPLQYLLSAAMFLLAASYGSLAYVQTIGQVYAYAMVQGFAGGTLTVMFFAVWGRAFGPAQLGRIQGAAQMMTVLASAIGPLVLAESRIARGSYHQVLLTFAAIAATFGLVAIFTTVPDAATGIWKAMETEIAEPDAALQS